MQYEIAMVIYCAVIPWVGALCMHDDNDDEKLINAAPYLFGLSMAGMAAMIASFIKVAQ